MSMLVRSAIVLVLLAGSGLSGLQARSGEQRVAGHLVIIGGGRRTPEIMKRFVALAGGIEKANIVVLPMASATPESTGIRQTGELRSYGVRNVTFRNLTREQAVAESTALELRGMTGVFFSGGVQSRITAIIEGTPVHRALLRLYHDGAVIGGTSAGAAVMSRLMITGDEALNGDSVNAFVFVRRNNIKTAEGLGFLDNAIVDQHFVKRKRHNRLISLVLEHPHLLGIGIDEATAIIVSQGKSFEVLGEGTVFVYDAGGATGIETDTKDNLSAENIRLDILKSGTTYDLVRRRVTARDK